MMDKIEQIDRELLLFINGMNSPFFDSLMWQISHQLIWVPLYLFFLIYAYRKLNLKSFIFFIIGVSLCFLFADRLSVMAFKEVFLRYRPSHNLEIKDLIHTYINSNGDEYRGGMYGFVSSHAANFSALSTFLFLNFKRNSKWWNLIWFWTLLILYSRMYLGVHYPLDIIGGTVLGISIGFVVYKVLTTFRLIKSDK